MITSRTFASHSIKVHLDSNITLTDVFDSNYQSSYEDIRLEESIRTLDKDDDNIKLEHKYE